MRAQLMLEMTFMLLVALSFVLLIAVLFAGVSGSYAKSTDSMGAYRSQSANALAQETLPYSEFHIITTNN